MIRENGAAREAARDCEPSQNWPTRRAKCPARSRADRQYKFQMQCRKLTGRPIKGRFTCAHGSSRRITDDSVLFRLRGRPLDFGLRSPQTSTKRAQRHQRVTGTRESDFTSQEPLPRVILEQVRVSRKSNSRIRPLHGRQADHGKHHNGRPSI